MSKAPPAKPPPRACNDGSSYHRLDLQTFDIWDLASSCGLLCLLNDLLARLGLAAPKVFLVLADQLSTIYPSLLVRRSSSVALVVQGRPILVMLVLEVEITAIGFQQLLSRDIFLEVFVELHLFFGDGIDEGRNELEEGADIPRDCL